jgi:excisionase family DNA binding protein
MDQLLTPEQAAERLACTESAVRKWISQRRLPAVKVGRLTRLRETDLEAFLDEMPKVVVTAEGGKKRR